MTMPKTKTPRWLIERAAQGELAGRDLNEMRERLAAEGRSLDDELDAIRRSDREILAELPRERMAAAIQSRAQKEARTPRAGRWRPMAFIAPTVLAGGLALAVLMIRPSGDKTARPNLQEPEEIGIKGDVLSSPRLLVYRQKSGGAAGIAGSERLADGARVARGDLLQLAYDKAPEGAHGVLLSWDGAGRVTLHLPEEGALASAPLTSVREIRLPSAYELDDAPSFERFVLVTSVRPFAIGIALDAARALAKRGAAGEALPLPLGPDYRQTSVLLRKTGKGAP